MTSKEIMGGGATRQLYEAGQRCPGCWSRQWYVGRKSAECARCGYSLPLENAR